jgi:hypothetical protein
MIKTDSSEILAIFRKKLIDHLTSWRGAAVLATGKIFSSSAEFYGNPYVLYKQLRDLSPVIWNPLLNVWFVTGYQEAEAIYRSSNAGWGAPPYRGKRSPEELHDYEKAQAKSLIFLDHPHHTRLRGLLHKAMAEFAWDALIRKNTLEILDNLKGRRSMDIVGDFGYHLTTAVIMDVIGIPEGDHEKMKPIMADQLATFEIERSKEIHEKGDVSMNCLGDYFAGLVVQRRRRPGDDLVSAFLRIEDDGDKLDDDEAITSAIMLLVGGYDNVNSLIANTMLALLTHPAVLAKVKADRGLLPQVIDEVLRFDPPVQLSYRRALTAFNVGNTQIAKGDGIVIVIAAANRDPRRFSEPDTLDVGRGDRGISFGLGIHTCLGARLALAEARIAIKLLFEKFPNISLDIDPASLEYHHSMMFRRLKSLPVAF